MSSESHCRRQQKWWPMQNWWQRKCSIVQHKRHKRHKRHKWQTWCSTIHGHIACHTTRLMCHGGH